MNKMVEKLSVLVVDDSHDMLELLRRNLNLMGMIPFSSDNVVDAIEVLETSPIDLVITDIKMPEISGLQLVKYISQHFPHIPLIVITGFPDVRNAVEVMKMGVMEYLVKPFTYNEFEVTVNEVLQLVPTGKKQTEEKGAVTERKSFKGLIGVSDSMQKLYNIIDRTKNNKATVLITGESGTGKEVVARAIHYNSIYSSAPFVAVNCGAIPEQLMESELFGYVKGAFTGASTTRTGFFQAADKGTLFLDEISNASLNVQAKLLRVIQEKEVTMLGATKSQKIDLRIISASNANLREMVQKQTFREDLFYRLNVITIEIPPLRERQNDIPLLINHFNQKFSSELNKKVLKFSKTVMNILTDYSWPGNIRELENFINQLVVMNDTKVDIHDIPERMKITLELPNSNKDTTLSLQEIEIQHIQKVLKATNFNKTKAAKILGIDRKTLREKLKQ